MVNLPDECLCCDLRVGVAIYGTIGLCIQLILIIYIFVMSFDFKYGDETYFWIFIGLASICALIWIIRTTLLITGVCKRNIKMMRAYYNLTVFDFIMALLYSLRQIIAFPVSIVGVLIGLGIGLYHLFCVKSLLVKMENEELTFNCQPKKAYISEP